MPRTTVAALLGSLTTLHPDNFKPETLAIQQLGQVLQDSGWFSHYDVHVPGYCQGSPSFAVTFTRTYSLREGVGGFLLFTFTRHGNDWTMVGYANLARNHTLTDRPENFGIEFCEPIAIALLPTTTDDQLLHELIAPLYQALCDGLIWKCSIASGLPKQEFQQMMPSFLNKVIYNNQTLVTVAGGLRQDHVA